MKSQGRGPDWSNEDEVKRMCEQLNALYADGKFHSVVYKHPMRKNYNIGFASSVGKSIKPEWVVK
jgi:hypothetical protein